jgi:iron complex transport system substrate-binding protein
LPKLTSSALPAAAAPGEIDRHVRASLHAGSSLYHLDAALLERLEPDLIVTQELCPVCAVSYDVVARAARRLRGDPRLVSLEPSSLDDVLANIALAGTLTGRESGAALLIASLRERIDALRRRTQNRAARPRTLMLEWTDPPMGGGHWTPGLVELAGGLSVLGCAGGNSARLEWRQIGDADPDAIVVVPCGFSLESAKDAAAALVEIPEFAKLRAYRDGAVLTMDGNAYVNRPGPRLVDSAEILAEFLKRVPVSAV